MLSPNQRQSMERYGYIKFASFLSPDELEQLKQQSETLVERTYNRDELEKHSVYPSDSTDTRVSHAVMISEGPSDFPKVEHSDLSMVDKFLKQQNQIISDLTGQPVAPGSRYMFNYQNYFSGSKPVAEHFDGEFLKTQRQTETVEFDLLEGILPRYVSLIIIANENAGKGVEFLDKELSHEYKPKLFAGDMVIFDNIRLRHRVPSLDQPRTSIGLRNFDHIPLHFAKDESEFLEGDYRKMAEGFVSENVNCQKRFQDFMSNEWPQLKTEYAHYF